MAETRWDFQQPGYCERLELWCSDLETARITDLALSDRLAREWDALDALEAAPMQLAA